MSIRKPVPEPVEGRFSDRVLLAFLSGLVLLAAGLQAAPAYARLAPAVPYTPAADLWITATADRAAAAPGDEVLLTVRCGNQGRALAAGTTVTVSLPSGIGLVEAYPAPAAQLGDTLTWETGSMGPQSQPFTILVKTQVTAAAPPGQTVLLRAGIAAAEPDADPANNLAQIPLYVGYRHSFPFFGNRFVAF